MFGQLPSGSVGELDDRPYWKPRDLAVLLGVTASEVHGLIASGELEHWRVGKRAIRVPARAVAAMLGVDARVAFPSTDGSTGDLAARADRFGERTGYRPEVFADAWCKGRIDDTPDSAADAIEALALRDALALPPEARGAVPHTET